jgi:hypothetical protein
MTLVLTKNFLAVLAFIWFSNLAYASPQLKGALCEPAVVGITQISAQASGITEEEIQRLEVAIQNEPWNNQPKPPFEHSALRYIPVLSKRTTFDFADWVQKTIDFTGDGGPFDHPDATKWLLRYHDFWKDKVSKEFYAKTASRILSVGRADEIAKNLDRLYAQFKNDPATLQLLFATVSDPRHYLEILQYLKREEIPLEVMNNISKWMTATLPVVSNKIIVSRSLPGFCGRCPKLAYGHRIVLFNSRHQGYGRAVFVYLRGQLVGSIKIHQTSGFDEVGDPSMLALTNVEDGHGLMRIHAGGVYKLTPEIIIRAYETFRHAKKWGRISVNSLEVEPLQFVGSNHSLVADPYRWHRDLMRDVERLVERPPN